VDVADISQGFEGEDILGFWINTTNLNVGLSLLSMSFFLPHFFLSVSPIHRFPLSLLSAFGFHL